MKMFRVRVLSWGVCAAALLAAQSALAQAASSHTGATAEPEFAQTGLADFGFEDALAAASAASPEAARLASVELWTPVPDGATPLSDDELADMRGGYMTAGGVTFDFGAVVRTYVGGALAMETRLTWTPTGPVTEQVSGGLPGWIPLADGGAIQAGGLNLTGLSPGSTGMILTDADGTTALIHNVLNGHLQNMVFNAADNRDIRQDMQLMLTLPNFEAMQRDYSIARLGSQISQDIDWGNIMGFAH